MKKNYTFKLKLSEDISKKLSVVAEKEGLSVQNLLVQLIRQKIQYFERLKGNIQKDALTEADLSIFNIEEVQ